MALNTNTYGYVIDPLFSFCDQGGKTIANGYVRVFRAGTSTPVLTYRNYDGAFNAETIELDNSGRTMTQVIASKGDLYKVCVYDAEHSQEDPILTVDKVAVIGASVNATNIVQGLNDVAGSGWIKSVAADDTAEISLDATNVTSEVDTMVKATAASADYMVPLVHKAGSDPDKKITLGNIFKFVLNFIHSLTDTATESDLVSGNYFALDGSAGTKKLNSTTLLTKTAQNALAGNVAPAFDPTRDEENPYRTNDVVCYNGKVYKFLQTHSGAWVGAHVQAVDLTDILVNVYNNTSFDVTKLNLSSIYLLYYNGLNDNYVMQSSFKTIFGASVLDVSALFPNGGLNGTDVYTLSTAISQLPNSVEWQGLVIRFKVASASSTAAYEYYIHNVAGNYTERSWAKLECHWSDDVVNAVFTGLTTHISDARAVSKLSCESVLISNLRKDGDVYKISVKWKFNGVSEASSSITIPTHDDFATETIQVNQYLSVILTYRTAYAPTVADGGVNWIWVKLNKVEEQLPYFIKSTGKSFDPSVIHHIAARPDFSANSIRVKWLRNNANSYFYLRVIVDETTTLNSNPFDSVGGRHTEIVKCEFEGFTIYVDGSKLNGELVDYGGGDVLAFNVANIQRVETHEFYDNNLDGRKTDGLFSVQGSDGSTGHAAIGKSGSIYKISATPCNKIHLYVEFRLDKIMAATSPLSPARLVQMPGSFNFRIFPEFSSYTANGALYPLEAHIYKEGAGAYGVGGFVANSKEYNPFNGNYAFCLRYTGASADFKVSVEDSSVKFLDGSTLVDEVQFLDDDSIDSLVNNLSALSYVSVTPVETSGRICKELIRCSNIPMRMSFTKSDSSTYTDNVPLYIPYALDEKWHSIEIAADFEAKKVYASYDGLTFENSLNGAPSSWVVVLGGTYSNENIPVTFRNFHADYGSFGDAEIITSHQQSIWSDKVQMISNHNPKLIIWEGHEVVVGTDADAENDPSMPYCESTSRIETVMTKLREKGYEFVTMERIIAWKKQGGTLPKRCFHIIMDDFRISNYLNVNKRTAFGKYGINPSLAIMITNSFDPSASVVINGRTYTNQEALAIIREGGWSMFTHIAHTRISDVVPSQLKELVDNDDYNCGKYGVKTNVIVYPYGDVATQQVGILRDTQYAVGVMTTQPVYNCKAVNDYWLTRNIYEMTTTVEDALSVIQ